jgi:CheY-like chemotaxis protein
LVQAKARILVVEDEGIVALDLKLRLLGFGYLVTALAASGEAAIQAAATTRPDLVLMDIRLQGHMDGIEAAREILARFDIPVIYITALSDDRTMQRIAETPHSGYILKPLDDGDLQTAIERGLSR